MSLLKIEVLSGSLELRLEGEPEMVSDLFNSIRDLGLGALHDEVSFRAAHETINQEKQVQIPKQHIDTIANADQNSETRSPDEQWPPFENIVLQGRPKNNQEWILVCLAYATSFGAKPTGNNEVKRYLQMTKRFNDSMKKNYARSIRSLASKNFIQALTNHEYIVSEPGLSKARQIVHRDQKASAKQKKTAAQKLPKYKLLDNLIVEGAQKEEFRDAWKSSEHSSAMDTAVFIAGWLKRNLNIHEVSVNHIFTMLRIVGENASFNILSALKNGKNQHNYFSNGSESNSFALTHVGEDRYTDLQKTD